MNYPGKELEIFDTAKVFQKYIYLLINKANYRYVGIVFFG